MLRSQMEYDSSCSVLFGLEAAIKLFAFGVRGYFSSKWHCFEITIVIVSIVTAVLSIGRLGNLIRMLRVLNVLRFLKISPSLQVKIVYCCLYS